MNAILKRVISLMLCFVLLVGYVPVSAFATESGETVTAEATDVTTAPIDVVSDEPEAPSESTEAPTDPSQETTAPTDATTAPTDATTAPTDATTAPTDAPTEPTDATTAPTEAATVPTEAPTEPEEEDKTEISTGSAVTVVKGGSSATVGTTATAASTGEAKVTARTNTDTSTDYLFIATDRHANTSIIGDIINNMESDIGENELDYLGLGGDMVGSGNSHPAYNSSTVLGEATGATSSLSAANVDIVAGIHDMNVTDDAGIVLPYQGGGAQIYEGDRFYVYGVPESCISGAVSGVDPETEANDFVTWANGSGIDKSKVIIVLSHYPLHQRRNDNDGAVYWAAALNTVAAGDDTTIDRDVAFFWGHNHTGETNADTAVYHKAPGSTISVQGGSSSQTIYFTYANAGYLNAKSSATLVNITDEKITFDKYVSSSVSTTNTVTRVKEAVTLSSIAITTAPTKTAYTVGETLDTTGMVVTATYSDTTTEAVTGYTVSDVDMTTAGTKTVTVTYEGKTATFDITVSEAEAEPAVNTVECWDDSEQVTVKATGLGLTAVTATNVTGENKKCDEVFTTNGYMAFDIALTGLVEGQSVEYSISVVPDLDITNLELYYIDENGELIPVECKLTTDELNNVYVEFTTDKVGTFVYGSPVAPEGYVLTFLVLANIPTDVFLGTSLKLDETAEVTATYTKEGAEDFVRKLTIYDYDADNFSGIDVNVSGKQTATFTFEGVSVTHDIYVWGDSFTTSGVTVALDTANGTEYGVTAAAVKESENTNVATAIADVIDGNNYVAYDISLTYSEGYEATENTKTVTLPIPEGVTNPVVYYVSDDGQTVTNMEAAKTEDGKSVTFTTDHFSTYVVGESAEDSSNEVTLGGTVTTPKTVYVLTSSISSGNNYLIVNSNSASATTRYALANNNGSVGATDVTIQSGDVDGDGDTETYIELTDATDELWTTSGSSSTSLQNGSYYLGYTTSNNSWNQSYNFGLSTTSRNWSYSTSNNRLSTSVGSWNSTTYYLRYNEGWTWTSSSNASGRSVYFYVPTEISTKVDTTVKYTMRAENLKQIVDTTNASSLTGQIDFCLQGNGTDLTALPSGGSYSFTILSESADIINGDIASDGSFTLTGTPGTAKVKVAYTWTQDEETHTVYKNITVEATEPYYTVDLCEPVKDEAGNTTYESITQPIALKGVEAQDTYSVWAVVKQYDGVLDENGEDGADIGDVDDNRLYWVVSDPSIATIDSATGKITFTGNNYGTFDVTVYYRDENDKVLCEDTITISATESQYVVPGDGTNDFPEYPDQGAIRFDKTAVAQGNFSQSGIAKVELSMTGVPYGTNTKTDVVIMVDMTASMSDDDVTASEAAVKELIESLVYDEENDKYDSNIQLFLDVFYSASSDSSFETKEYMNGTTISTADELTAAKALIDFTQSSKGGGTRYNLAMKDVYDTLNREGHADKQYVVFVSDGVATAYAPLTNGTLGTTIIGSNSETSSLAAGWFDDDGEVTDEFQTEYYSYLIKKAGIPIYTVGANLTALSDAADVLNHMSSNYSANGKVATGETKYSFFCTTSGGITDEVLEIFHGIGTDIREAATNVVVEDKIDSHYTVNFSLPSGVTAAEAGGMDDFYIQVLGYELDENNDRKANPAVLEKFLFGSDGTITHTIGTAACGDTCTHVTKTGDTVTGIDGTYFDYTIDENGDEFLTWKADKLDRTELALEYFVYLDNSAGAAAADQVKPGTYDTNEYATITYTNFNGKECQQYFPVPSMTWKGAKVTYVFYLVNENGQPVNRAGKIIPFAESFYVTDPVTIDVTWNELEGSENMLAENLLASANVPDVYSLYDDSAYYEIRVYQTEGVDSETQAKNYNYFIIEGSDAVSNKETTKVFNTKAGNRYDDYGAYSATAGSYTSHNSNAEYTATVTTGIDYANTTVAFAVVWKPELKPDTVVVDYGLDVVIDVTTNDSLASGVTGVSTTAPNNVTINSGTYANSVMGTSADLLIDDLIIGTAKKESLTSVRFSLNKNSGMQFNEPVDFYYESECNYYTYDSKGDRTLNTTHMYSSVTVIPATTIYYEDEFVELKTYTLKEGSTDEYNMTAGWDTNSVEASATQAQDRPGASQISAALDADNNYGYDSAYTNMSEYSMGGAAMTNVKSGKYATAEFDFYGTGFDVISLTSNQTGTITIQVTGETEKKLIVDTYYGYTQNENGEWVISANDPNALYQVPVMKVEELNYGKHHVVITATYSTYFDHTEAEGYDLYLDAIRIYDPTGNQNETANNAYVADGEGWPQYIELRNNIIAASNYKVTKNDDGTVTVTGDNLPGAIFIDSNDENTSIADYVSYGPNNELYLAAGQSVSFALTQTANVADVQIAMKLGNGDPVNYKIYDATKTTAEAAASNSLTDGEPLTTATDLYYSIKDLSSGTIVISNTSGGILSITNIKVTYTQNPYGTATSSEDEGIMTTSLFVDEEVATAAVMSLRTASVDEEETTAPETSEPENSEPETSEPETSEPETSEPESTVPEETEPENDREQVEEAVKEAVQTVINTVKNVLKNLFSRWFR